MSECKSKKTNSVSIQVRFKESVLCKWTKYGNLSDRRGVLAAPVQIYTLLFKKNMLFVLFNGWAVLSYITFH